MKQFVRRFVKRLLSLIGWDEWQKPTWSQEGEDCILRRYFESHITSGYYIDIGAHHPYRFSNTMLFYKRGWSGINIDATPGSMKMFERIRPRDINIESGIGITEETKRFYIFNEPALNGFDEKLSAKIDEQNNEYSIINTKELSIKPLHKLLSEHLPKGQKIDFISIDVEGLDLEVLQSNDWGRFRPELVLVEKRSDDIEEVIKSDLNMFMRGVNYILYAKTVNTLIYKNRKNEMVEGR